MLHHPETDNGAGAGSSPALRLDHLRRYVRRGRAPWRIAGGEMRFLTTGPCGSPLDFHVDRKTFNRLLRARLADEIRNEATEGLASREPQQSAKGVPGLRPLILGGMALSAAIAVFALDPAFAGAAIILAFSAYFLAVAVIRCFLVTTAARAQCLATPPELSDRELPSVTILAPLFREAHALPGLVAAIGNLDYPREKLDVKILLEENDDDTLREALKLRLDEMFDLVVIPPSHPQTKPKACNYGLACAQGDLIVIYDAEDEPDPGQLRSAAAVFAQGGDALACVQARLNYYNPDENWLTRLFTLEYCLWFDHFLPALDRIGAPVPLGGTSNIFKTDILAAAGGWDPYNVTEDADLGFRLARKGYQTTVIASSTLEEANCQVGNWMRQRSRWMKGFMQTWVVERRNRKGEPFDWRSRLSSDFFIGGAVFTALANPVLWAFLIIEKFGFATPLDGFPEFVRSANIAALACANITLLALAAYAPFRRGLARLSPAAILMPVYWIMMSIAAWRALIQLVANPSYWEKTDHGLSAEAKSRRLAALQTFGLEQETQRSQVSCSGRTSRRPGHARTQSNEPLGLAIPEDERPRQ